MKTLGELEFIPPRASVPVEDDFRAHWLDFCDADYFDGIADFPERMEEAGLIRLVPVTREALDEAFAADRGLYPGGMMWEPTPAGFAALAEGKP